MAAKSHRDVVVAYAQRESWQRCAELGVGSGHLFERLLEACPELQVVGVDLCRVPARARRLLDLLKRFGDRAHLAMCSTTEAAPAVLDGSLDGVFIDAGHSYDAVAADIRAWWPKARPGAWFGGHDYHQAFPGVVCAVDNAFSIGGLLPGAATRDVHHELFAVWWVRR